MSDERFHRQDLLFGREGQTALESVRVAVLGLGGLGSHVTQQLTYLGVGNQLLIDYDRVESSNLNRLIGATEADGTSGAKKTDVAMRLVASLLPNATIEGISAPLVDDVSFAALRDRDFVFGCVDNDSTRLILNELCQAYEVPYLDLATDTHAETGEFGGRMMLADGRACLVCKRLLDDEAIRHELANETQRKDDSELYGVDRGALGETGPAVVSVNGIIASLAVTEFLCWATDLREPNLYLEYRSPPGVVRRDATLPDHDCYYCHSLRGTRAGSNVQRYLTNSIE